jgi:hypothetical protein
MRKTVLIKAVGCTIEGGQEAKTEILAKMEIPVNSVVSSCGGRSIPIGTSVAVWQANSMSYSAGRFRCLE